MPTRESLTERKAVAYAKSLGFLVFKNVCPGQRDVPDRKFIRQGGEHLYIEFKAPKKKPTPGQRHMLEKLRKQGVAAAWTDNYAEAMDMLLTFKSWPEGINKEYLL